MRLSRRSKRRLGLLIAIIVIGAGSVVAFKSIRAAQQQRLVSQARDAGMSAYAAGDLDTTLRQLSYVFQHEKDDLQVNLTFAQARARSPIPGGRHLWEAVDLYTTHGIDLLRRKPDLDPDGTQRRLILDRLLDTYCKLGLSHEVIQTSDQLLALDPDHVVALSAKAEALGLDAEYEKAMPLAARLMELEPDNLAWRRLHLQLAEASGIALEQRIEQCRQWAASHQSDGRFHLLTASLLLEADRVDEARSEIAAAATLGASSAEVLSGVVELLDLLDLRAQAQELITRTIQQHPQEPWAYEVAVRRCWHNNNLEQATAWLQQASQQLDALSIDLHRLQIIVNICADRLQQAQDELQQLQAMASNEAQNDPHRAWAQALSAAVMSADAPWKQRLESLQEAIALQPEDPVLHSLLGDLWMQVGEHALAIISYQRAFTLEPQWLAAGIAYGDALLQAGRLDEAYHTSRIVVSRADPEQLVAFILYARAYLAVLDSGRWAEVPEFSSDLLVELIAALRTSHQSFPTHADLAGLLVEALALKGDSQAALQVAADAQQTASMSVDALLAIAHALHKHDLDLPTCEQLLLQAQQKLQQASSQPASVHVAAALAQLDAQRKRPEHGLRRFDAIIAASNHQPQIQESARLIRAAFMVEHQLPGAAAELRALLMDAPQSIHAQRLALAQPQAWMREDPELGWQALDQLREQLGDTAAQVKLAEANLLLRLRPDDEASLAKAIVQIEGVLLRSPDSLAALSLLSEAMMLSRQPNVDRAIECLERATQLYSAEPSLLVRLIALLQQRGDFSAAGGHLRTLAHISESDPRLKRIELRLLQQQGDFETALVRAVSLQRADSSVDDQLLLAAIHERAGQRDQAEAIYQRLLSDPNASSLARSQAAEFFANTGRFERGLELMHSIISQMPKPRQNLVLGSYHLRHGYLNQARSLLHQAVEGDPQSIEARSELARCHLALQDRQAAREQALAGLKIAPQDPGLRATLAVASLGLNPSERAQAIAQLRQINAANEDLLAVLNVLQDIRIREGKPAITNANLAAARRLVETNGRFLPAWQLAITLHVEAGRVNEAIVMARSAVSRFPAQPEPSQWATQLLISEQHYTEALTEALEWRRRAINDPLEVDAIIASILLQLNRASEAVARLEPAVEQIMQQQDRHPDRLHIWIQSLALSGRYQDAATLIQPLLQRDAQWRQAWLSLAVQLPSTEAYQALTLLDDVQASATERLALALQWIAIGRRDQCSECLQRAAAHAQAVAADDQDAPDAIMVQAAIAEARKDFAAAEALYRDVLTRRPDHPPALNNLAYLLARHPDRSAEALPLIQRALELQPDQPDFLDTYGHALLNLGRHAEAEQALQRALRLRPHDLNIAVSLAEAQLHSNDHGALVSTMLDLQQRFKLQPHLDPDLAARFEALWNQFQKTEQQSGT